MELSSILNMWNKWNIRGFVILSLSLQIFLILFASLRKKTTSQPIIFLLWLAYLMADCVAAFTIGLISHNQDICTSEIDRALQAFWASFLLLHLGGPDTITAFSLEDSSLWRRHLLNIVFQVGAAVYVFVQIFLSDKSLVIPTILVFLAGVIKNVQRILALHLSSLPKLRERMLLQHNSFVAVNNELIEELNVLGDGYANGEEAKLPESTVVKHAYYYYHIFKFFREIISFDEERKMTCKYFHKISAVDALRVISIQLHFMYEVLHTKALVMHSKWSHIFRFIAFTNVVMACFFFNRLKKHWLPALDVEITFILLFGGIALDVIALFMLVFSDWTIARIKWCKRGSSKLYSFPLQLVSTMGDMRKPQFTTCDVEPNANITYVVLDTPFIFRKWSESIFACNLISESLKESPRKMYKGDRCWAIVTFFYICNFPLHMVEKIISCFHQAGETIVTGCSPSNKRLMITNTRYVSKIPLIKHLWIFIFKEVRRKSEYASDLTEMKKIFEARGDQFIRNSLEEIDCGNLLEYVTCADYPFIVLTWHFATEIWYNREEQFMSPTARNDKREFSKILSDYMLYLFLNQANLVSAVADVSQITSAQMLVELRCYIRDATRDVKGLCKRLYEDCSIALHEGSPLRSGIELAHEMERLGEMKWKVMSGVWVEILFYTAGHIKPEAHVQMLSKGGELLVFIWLLMVHFGFFNYIGDVLMPNNL